MQGECLGLVAIRIGKSVVLRSLIGIEKGDGGEIWIEGGRFRSSMSGALISS